MSVKTRGKETVASTIVSEEFIFWLAASVMGYSLLVPLLALESLFLAESVLQFGLVHQAMMILLVMLAAINVLGKTVVEQWKSHYWLSMTACTMLLVSVQPAIECCSNLIAALSGMVPANQISLTDVLIHLLPIGGCTLLMCEGLFAQRLASKAKQSKLVSR